MSTPKSALEHESNLAIQIWGGTFIIYLPVPIEVLSEEWLMVALKRKSGRRKENLSWKADEDPAESKNQKSFL